MSTIKVKRFPITFRSPLLAELSQSCAAILAINWLFQGMRGMESKELGFRLALLVLGTLAGTFAGLPVPLALFLAHSFNFLLNGQFWVCARYCRAYGNRPERLDDAMAATVRILRRQHWLDEAVCIGSLGRRGRVTNDRSDLDIRLVFPSGIAAWLRTNLLLLRLRAEALFRRVPLDLYAYDTPEALARFDQSEPLLLIQDRNGRLRHRYVGRELRTLP